MPDTDQTSAENEANAEEITRTDATEDGARGNTQSERDPSPKQEAPPPMPN